MKTTDLTYVRVRYDGDPQDKEIHCRSELELHIGDRVIVERLSAKRDKIKAATVTHVYEGKYDVPYKYSAQSSQQIIEQFLPS